MKKITLEQLLQYADTDSEQKQEIQVVMPGDDFKDRAVVWADSKLLEPFLGYEIESMDIVDQVHCSKAKYPLEKPMYAYCVWLAPQD